jgi:membrane protein
MAPTQHSGRGAGGSGSGLRDAAGRPFPSFLIAVGLAWLALARHRVPPAGGRGPRTPPAAARDRPDAEADSPTEIPARGWWQVLKRVVDRTSRDDMTIIAAGCAFYALLGLFPGITALVSIYGLLADPAAIERQLAGLASVVPKEAVDLIAGQAHAVAAAGRTALGWGAALALLLALYGATSGVKTLFEALNIAYEQEERRGFLRLNLAAFAFTLAAVVGVATAIAVIVGVPAALRFLPLGPLAAWAVRIVSWLILAALVVVGIGLLYRFGPSRAPARWRWITPGSLAAAGLWLAASVAFSFYAARFGAYNQTYGALGGVIILLVWLWLGAFAVLLGAELNAELELQAGGDTTTGAPLPKGERDAYVADHTAAERAADPPAR